MEDGPDIARFFRVRRNIRPLTVCAAARVGAIVAVVLASAGALRGDTTNIFSPVVSYQYAQGMAATPLVSYQHPDGIAVSPVVSFDYPDGISFSRAISYRYDESGAFSPLASYYYQFVLDSVGDGIPDLWRARYFGGYGTATDSLSCATGDASGTGQNNWFKYIAGLDPTNPASVFVLVLTNAGSGRADIVFNPRWSDRTYEVEASTNLLVGGFLPLARAGTNDAGAARTVIDLNAADPQRFYRVRIHYP